jgi:adenine-specific DNA-methyltransferase
MSTSVHPPLLLTDVVGNSGPQANLLIRGDCESALAALEGDDRPSVRLAYLDPPFNTGERFRDYNDALSSTDWQAFIVPRLASSWKTLQEHGSLWIHCDDSEQATLRVLMDEMVGRERFVATIVWQRRYSRENRRSFSTAHDYIHVYAPMGGEWKHHRNRLPRQDKAGTWRNPDNDPRGEWSTVSLVAQGGHGTKEQFYSVTTPTGRIVEPPEGSCWRVTKPRLEALVAEGLIWFGKSGNNVPRRKVYLSDAQGLVPSTWWTHLEAGHNAEASSELRSLFPDRAPFSTPKPERLMLRIIEIATSPGDLVLDPFLGSATTAAVAHKASRHWIGIEENQATIDNIARPRLVAVTEGRDPGGVTDLLGWEGGSGFRCGTVMDPSVLETIAS